MLKDIAKKAKVAAANPSIDAGNAKGTRNRMDERRPEEANDFFSYSMDFSVCVSVAPMASQADVQRIRDAIKNASSLAEVERLTRILQSGNIPQDLNLENSNGNGNGNG